jgi:concentrative nucleoside transporter, CNT family
VLIVSYALSGFAHVASVGIFVGGMVGLVPSRRKDISELGWKALFAGTLATMMIACLAGFYDNGNPSIMGDPAATPAVSTPAAPNTTVSPVPTVAPTVSPSPKASPSPKSTTSPSPKS